MEKIFFINPPSPSRIPIIRDAHRSGRSSKEGMIWCQTNLAQLASLVPSWLEPKIIDCIAEGLDYSQLQYILYKEAPKYVVFQVIPATFENDMRVAEIAKSYGATTIAIGPHATSNPADILTKSTYTDFVISGEVEANFRDVLEGKVSDTIKDFIDLDTLPPPRYDLLPLNKYYMPFLGKYVFIVASRGCPFNCIFCRERVVFHGEHRIRSIKNIIEDVRYLKRYKIDTYLFHSGCFTVVKPWVLEFCEAIKKEKIKWGCNTHLRTIDEEMSLKMKQAGCIMIAPGIESGSQAILDNIRKQTTIPLIREKVNMIANTGIKVWGYFVFGFPGETNQTMQETIDFACSLPLDIAHFGMAAPYYGTDFYKMCIDNHWLKAKNWEDYDQNRKFPIEYPDLKEEDVKIAIRQAYLEFYLRPRKLWRLIKEGLRTPPSILWRIGRSLL